MHSSTKGWVWNSCLLHENIKIRFYLEMSLHCYLWGLDIKRPCLISRQCLLLLGWSIIFCGTLFSISSPTTAKDHGSSLHQKTSSAVTSCWWWHERGTWIADLKLLSRINLISEQENLNLCAWSVSVCGWNRKAKSNVNKCSSQVKKESAKLLLYTVCIVPF